MGNTVEQQVTGKIGVLRRLYYWVLEWADTPYGPAALVILAFAEASFFPIPPDVLLMALALGEPKKSFRYALLATIGSVTGGMLGYYIGYKLMDTIGVKILTFYGAMEKFEYLRHLYNEYNAWFLAIAGFTPIPYKVFTIASGAFHSPLLMFVVVSALSRAARFYLVALFFYFFGEKARDFIERYFNLLTILFVVLLVGGFFVIKYLIR